VSGAPGEGTAEEPEVPGELRRALDDMPAPDARAEFRSELKRRFVAGASERAEPEAALAAWRVPAARAAFRAELRRRFVAAPRAARARLWSVPRALAAGLIAAAALVVLFAPWGGRDGPWSAVDYAGSPTVAIDGRPVSYGDRATLSARLEAGGCRLVTTETFRAYRSEELLLELAPGSDVRLLPRAADGMLVIELASGGLRVSTAPGLGERVLIRTPQAEVALAGRAVGVEVLAEGTCICCLDGRARVTPRAEGQGAGRTLGDDEAYLVWNDARPPLELDHVVHRDELSALSAASAGRLY